MSAEMNRCRVDEAMNSAGAAPASGVTLARTPSDVHARHWTALDRPQASSAAASASRMSRTTTRPRDASRGPWLVPWPADSVPDGTFLSFDQLMGNGEEDRVVLKPMSRGEPCPVRVRTPSCWSW